MRYIFEFPDIGEGITEGKVLEIYVSKGQEIKEGDSIVKVETDKVVTDIPSPKTGTVKNIFAKEGDTVNVDEALMEMEVAEEELEEEEKKEEKGEGKKEKKEEKVEEEGFGVVGVIEDSTSDAFLPSTGEGMEEKEEEKEKKKHKKTLATPVARKMAKDYGLDINEIEGTGPAGRVMKADIRKAFEEKQKGVSPGKAKKEKETKKTEIPQEEKTEVEEISQIRRTIATKMVESKFTAPHAVSFEEVEISKLVQLREEKKKTLAEKDIKLSYMAFIIKAVTIALKNHKKLNSRLDLEKNRIIYNYYYNIGIATDTPAGLMVPVIKDTDKKSIIEISQEINDLVKRAKERKLNIDELKGSTFSITNYGSIAGIYGVPIINYPDVAILGVGRILDKPVVKNGAVVPGKVLPLSISIDHRIIDGADAARFIKEIMELLAEPMIMLMM